MIWMNSGFNIGAYSTDEYLAIGLDFYLGNENRITKLFEIGRSDSLWKLTTKGVNWNWNADRQFEFDQIKKSILRTALAYFNQTWDTIIEVDASLIGTAAFLWQENPNDAE